MPEPIAPMAPWPLMFHGVKLPLLMKNRPTIDTNRSAANLRIVVINWTEPMFFTPDRLMTAGIHRPISTSRTVISLFWPLLMNTSTYRTQPTAIPALPAHAVIQYDQALKKPTTLPNAARE